MDISILHFFNPKFRFSYKLAFLSIALTRIHTLTVSL